MKDRIIRGSADDFRFFVLNATNVVKEAKSIHKLPLIETDLMGRLIIAGLLTSQTLKNTDDSITIKLDSDGPLTGGLVSVTKAGAIKGYLNNYLDMDNLTAKTFKDVVGNGTLTVMRSIGDKKPYIGLVELISGEIGEDLAYYYLKSEQINSAVSLGVLFVQDEYRQAGGFMVQLLPNAKEESITILENNLAKLPSFTDLLDMEYSLEKIMEEFVLKGFDIEYTEEVEPFYQCDCSKDKFRRGIISIGKEEIKQICDEGKPIDTECHFCNKVYSFDHSELVEILNSL